jgi:hypothetical protein
MDAKWSGRGCAAVVIGAVLALGAARASAACRASADGAHSFDTRMAPLEGGACRMTVDVFPGRSCAPPARWHVALPCDQTRQMAISNRGRLISILLPRTKRQDLNVVRITWSPEKYAWAPLAKLTGTSPLRGEVRLTLEGDALRLKADRTLLIPFETVRQLASSMAD